jgi:hypothetical protein
MSRAYLFFLLMAGCAETQSQQAFTPRRPAEEVPAFTTPNRFGEHDRALAESIDRSLQALEDEPMIPARPAALEKESSPTRDVRTSGDSRASKTAGN